MKSRTEFKGRKTDSTCPCPFNWMCGVRYVICTGFSLKVELYNVYRYKVEPLVKGIHRDRDDLSTKDTCFNPLLILHVTSEIGQASLYTRDKTVGPIVFIVQRFHCILM